MHYLFKKLLFIASGLLTIITGFIIGKSHLVHASLKDGQTFDDWAVSCIQNNQKKQVCFLNQYHEIVKDNQKEIIAAYQFGYIGSDKKLIMTQSLPLGISLQPGTTIISDSKIIAPGKFKTCTQNGCQVTVTISDAELEDILSTGKNYVAMMDLENKQINIPLSNKGLKEGLTAVKNNIKQHNILYFPNAVNDYTQQAFENYNYSIRVYKTTNSEQNNNQINYAFPNCAADSFNFALQQPESKKQRYDSEALKKWIINQNKVFDNCSAADLVLPEAPAESVTKKQVDDYNYQIAASHFYNLNYDKSAESFEQISNDQSSFYKDIAFYPIFRSHFRQTYYQNGLSHIFRNKFDRYHAAINKSPYKDAINKFNEFTMNLLLLMLIHIQLLCRYQIKQLMRQQNWKI